MEKPRLTLTTAMVLRMIRDRPGIYGLEIIKQTGYAGGSIYPVLHRLEQAGWITSTWEHIDPSEAGRPPRCHYRLTDRGRMETEAALAKIRRHHLGE